MSGAVDVVAVMDRLIAVSNEDRRQFQLDRFLAADAEAEAEERAARAAVAELIETQQELLLEIERARSFETDIMQRIPSDTLRRAQSALARVGGAS